MTYIEVRNLTKRYGETVAVNDVNFEVEHKKLLTILGPSGCGKTTTLRLIAGFIKPDAGEIFVDGKLLSNPTHVVPPEKRNFGMVFQSFATWPHLTVRKNIEFGLRLRKLPEEEVNKRVKETLEMVKLDGLEDRYPSQLSGGQQQRVSLARSVVVRPKVLLLDEPLSNLDAKLRETMRLDLTTLQKTFGITSIYVTHDQLEAMALSDVVAVMDAGSIIQIDSPHEIYENPRTQFVADFVGAANLISGKVLKEVEGKKHFFVTEKNEKICVSTNADIKEGDKYLLSIKTENVQLSKKKPLQKTNVFEGTVTKRVYLGSKTDYWISTRERVIRATGSGTHPFDIGDKVYLYLDPETCVLVRAN